MQSINRFLSAFILVVFSLTFLNAQDIVPPPDPPRLVVDKANVLLHEQAELLEEKLVLVDDSSSNQIAVLIIPTLNDYPIEDYALKVLRTWGVGGKDHNNGVLLLIAIDDRKVRIETGYGLEGAIPDITAKSIIDNHITTNFRNGNYYRGIDEATDALALAAVGEYREPRKYEREDSGPGLGTIIFLIILFLFIFSIMGGRNNKGGGNSGRKGGGMVSRRGYGDYIPPVWIDPGGWGGSRGGGFGGGFGGFGGGGGGGGGASGGW